MSCRRSVCAGALRTFMRRLFRWSFRVAVVALIASMGLPSVADDGTAGADRRQRAEQFHRRAQERTGILVPLYVYPGDVDANAAYGRLIELKRRYETIPVWVIVNQASGPGESADPNYVNAVDRLVGAGCVVLGYVTTSYGRRAAVDVHADIDRWLTLYPRVQGIFFDEMTYEDTDAGPEHQAALTRYAHDAGCWPVVANPGADTPARYFAAEAADVIVVHEGSSWPAEERLSRYRDFPPFGRAVLVHSQWRLDVEALARTRRYARWVYVTDAEFRPGDPAAANPWDRLPRDLEALFAELAR